MNRRSFIKSLFGIPVALAAGLSVVGKLFEKPRQVWYHSRSKPDMRPIDFRKLDEEHGPFGDECIWIDTGNNIICQDKGLNDPHERQRARDAFRNSGLKSFMERMAPTPKTDPLTLKEWDAFVRDAFKASKT